MQGFSSWSRRDFNAFTRACEKYGRHDLKSIASEVEGKTVEEVERYSKVFWERYKELAGMSYKGHGNPYELKVFLHLAELMRVLRVVFGADYDRIIKNIEKGEARITRKDEIMKSVAKKLDRYKNPWLEMKIQYGQNKGKLYNEECDRFLVCFQTGLRFLCCLLLLCC